MEALTLGRAVELANQIVAEFGEDYVYPDEHKMAEFTGAIPSCVYVHDGKPSCLAGQILHRHGVPIEKLSEYEFRGAWLVSERLAEAEYGARFFLDIVQGRQDRGMAWGEAVQFAENHVRSNA